MCDLHQQEQVTEEMTPVALTFSALSILNSQRVGITPSSMSHVGWVVEAWSLLKDFINGEGGDGSAVFL